MVPVAEQRDNAVVVGEDTKRHLDAFLASGDAPMRLTPRGFIEWAIGVARQASTPCEDDGSLECLTHPGGYRSSEDGPCEDWGMAALYPIDRG